MLSLVRDVVPFAFALLSMVGLLWMLIETLRAKADVQSLQHQLSAARGELQSAWSNLEHWEGPRRLLNLESQHKPSVANALLCCREAAAALTAARELTELELQCADTIADVQEALLRLVREGERTGLVVTATRQGWDWDADEFRVAALRLETRLRGQSFARSLAPIFGVTSAFCDAALADNPPMYSWPAQRGEHDDTV